MKSYFDRTRVAYRLDTKGIRALSALVIALVEAVEDRMPDMDLEVMPVELKGLRMLRMLIHHNPAPYALELYLEPLLRWAVGCGDTFGDLPAGTLAALVIAKKEWNL